MHPLLISQAELFGLLRNTGSIDWRKYGLDSAIEQECRKAEIRRQAGAVPGVPTCPAPASGTHESAAGRFGFSAPGGPSHDLPDMRLWTLLLKNGKTDILAKEMVEFLMACPENDRHNLLFLNRLLQDTLQMVYGVLRCRNLSASCLFIDLDTVTQLHRAGRSAADFLEWFRETIIRVSSLLGNRPINGTIVERVQRFIRANLGRDLSCDEIAAQVGMNPDYLTRLLKKEAGLSVSEFLQKERLATACELLAKTNLPVSCIALQCGYVSFSHFSRQFHRLIGRSPAAYRKEMDHRRVG